MSRIKIVMNLLALGIPQRIRLRSLVRSVASAQRRESAGHRTEAIKEYENCLELARNCDRLDMVLYLRLVLAGLYHQAHDHSKARVHATEGINVARNTKEPRSLAYAQSYLASIVAMLGEYPLAVRLCEECRQFFEESDDSLGLATIDMTLGHVAETTEVALSHFTHALALYENANQRTGVISILCSIGHLAEPGRDNGFERSCLNRCLAMSEKETDRRTIAYALNNLANIDRFEGNLQKAAQGYVESLILKKGLDDEWAISYSLDGCAAIATAWGEGETAAKLYGAADAIRKRLKTPLEPRRRSIYQQGVAATRQLCGEDEFEVWWREGEQMSTHDATEVACNIKELGSA